YDAIVVGSGISGGWAAKELTEKGLKTLLLERGQNIEHITGYVNATKAPWDFPHRGGRTKAMEAAYPVLKRDYPLNEKNLADWVDGLPVLPDGKFLPAMPLNCGEEIVAGRIQKAFDGKRRMIPGRVANATKQLPGRNACQYRNACWLGCPYGGYFSTQSSTLPFAQKTGRLTLKPYSIASEVLYDKNTKRATGVRVIDATNNQVTDYKAK